MKFKDYMNEGKEKTQYCSKCKEKTLHRTGITKDKFKYTVCTKCGLNLYYEPK